MAAKKSYRLPQNVPGGTRGHPKGVVHLPMTDARRDAFLIAYRNSGGSLAAACRATAPHLSHTSTQPPAYSTWRQELQNNLEFRAAFLECKQQIVDDLEAMAHTLAVTGVKRRVHQKGGLVWEPKFDENGNVVLGKDGKPIMVPAEHVYRDSRVLLARLRALAPERYGDHKTVDVRHYTAGAPPLTLGKDDVVCLSAEQRRQLSSILNTIKARRAEMAALPVPDDAVDAEYEELAEFDLGEEGLSDA